LSIRPITFVEEVSGARASPNDKEQPMSATIQTIANSTAASTSFPTARRSSLRRSTVLVGVAAAAATTAVAAAAHAAGVSFAVDGEMIPLAGFAQLAFVATIIGGLLLAVLNRRSSHPRRRFPEATIALTVLSCVPSVLWPDDVATKVTLVAIHLLAAAIVIPVLARHARD
jgi:peptidoglycan/LPS O-acetylase OafA/YrhL